MDNLHRHEQNKQTREKGEDAAHRLLLSGFNKKQIEAMGERATEVARLPAEKRTELRRRLSGEDTVPLQQESEKLQLFRDEMTRWFSEMFQKNNEALLQKVEESVVERMARELKYLLREQEEKEEERYKRLDRTIRACQERSRQKKAEPSRKLQLFSWKGNEKSRVQ